MTVDLTFDEVAALRSVAKSSVALFDEKQRADGLSKIEMDLVDCLNEAIRKLERAALAERVHQRMAAGR